MNDGLLQPMTDEHIGITMRIGAESGIALDLKRTKDMRDMMKMIVIHDEIVAVSLIMVLIEEIEIMNIMVTNHQDDLKVLPDMKENVADMNPRQGMTGETDFRMQNL